MDLYSLNSCKMVQMNLFAGRHRDTDVENKRMDTKGGKRSGGGG